MASLRSDIAKGMVIANEQIGSSGYPSALSITPNHVRCILSDDTKCINIQSVVDQVVTSSTEPYEPPSVPSTPPFENVWMEAVMLLRGKPMHFGLLVTRMESRDGWDVKAAIYQRSPGTAKVAMTYDITYELTQEGVVRGPLFTKMTSPIGEEDLSGWGSDIFRGEIYPARVIAVAQHSFARMHCANVELVAVNQNPLLGLVNRIRHKTGTVWHVIKVSTDLKHSQKMTGWSSGNVREIRSHWIRGHYADYTKGSGLFGKSELRKVFWVPEHKAGSADTGEVIGSYKIC